jgi:hypothetical protein
MSSTTASLKVLTNLGVLESKLPFDLFKNLKITIDNMSDSGEKFNDKLLGHMQEEYSLNHIKDNMSDFLIAMANTWQINNPGYLETFEEVSKCKNYKLILDSLWVNKQKKYEFNPIHLHSGVLSFVIWINIPYELKNEESYFPPISGETEADRSSAYTSKFTFVYNDILGRIQSSSVPVDKTWEGTILMFPAGLHHCVYPFYTSDDYRISVSGNIRIQTIDN